MCPLPKCRSLSQRCQKLREKPSAHVVFLQFFGSADLSNFAVFGGLGELDASFRPGMLHGNGQFDAGTDECEQYPAATYEILAMSTD
jgi:hypothetical protein